MQAGMTTGATATKASPTTMDEEALIRAHLPLVHYGVADVAARIPRHVNGDDLLSAGMLGLLQAARTFDPARGVPFERFARARIRFELIDELRRRDWASRSVRTRSKELQAATSELTSRLGRVPTPAELGEHIGIPAADVLQLADDVHRATVLNYDSVFLEPEESTSLASSEAGPVDVLVERERQAYLRDAVVALPERLRHVVVGYFFEERPMQELADELGVTESRISQMRAEALELLRDGMRSQLDPAAIAPERVPDGRVARRKAAYYAEVAAASDYRSRLDARPVPVQQRVGTGTA
jgi:RNA polymerase sigma factor for flagellar operon FliA